MNILLIEDHKPDAVLLRELLTQNTRHSFRLAHAERLQDGLALLKRDRFDAALLDLSLPDAFGEDSFWRLHRQAPNLPIIILTGLDDEDLAIKLAQAGAEDYLVKSDLTNGILHRGIHYAIERKRVEEKLNAIFNASVEGIITYDLNDIIVSANATVEVIFGYKPEELVGCNIGQLIHSSPNNYQPQTTASAAGQIKEVDGIHKDGSIVPLDLSAAEFTIDNQHYFTYIVRDVSLRKHQAQQDKMRLDELAHTTRLSLMGEMASGIAHEVNQPLSAISTYTQVSLNMINNAAPDLMKLAEVLRKTQQQALRAGRIIHRMREFIKSNSKHCLIYDMNELIRDAVGLCLPEIKQNGIQLSLELENKLPPVLVDQIQIEQVLINLIRNSINALQNLSGKQLRRLTIHSRLTPQRQLVVSVNDNGPGLDEEQQQKILTPFYTTKANGMGMGLSISRSLIEAHDGNLAFDSQAGKGTSFYFTLPVMGKNREPQ